MLRNFKVTTEELSEISHINQWKVLIVDDVEDNKFVAETILTFSGATVLTANDGLHALEVLERFDANIILLDLSMPEMDGWEMLDILKKQKAYHHVPIIALTAHAMQSDKERALDAGFTGYITKPYDAQTFIPKIEGIIQSMYFESM